MIDRAAVAGRGRGRRGWLAGLVWGLLALLLAALAVVLTGACGLSLPGGARPFLVFCPPPASAAVDPGSARLAVERQRQAVLEERLRRLDLRLAAVPDCPQPPPVAVAEPAPVDIPEEDWEDRDIGLLEGCWSLINDMQVTDLETTVAYPVEDWRICFDESGVGEQTIVYRNGTRCTGAIQADFLPDGRLRFADERDIACDGGFVIFRIINECTRLPDGTARCIGAQPDRDIADVESIFQRHEGAN